MLIKTIIVILSFLFSFFFFYLLDFFDIIKLDIYLLLFYLITYFGIGYPFVPEVNKVPLNKDYHEFDSILNRGINCEILDIRSLVRKRKFLDDILFSTIYCFLYPVIFIFWCVQFFSNDLAGKLLCSFEVKLAHYFYKDYVYKIEEVIEKDKTYEKWYWTSSKIEWRLNGLLHRETDIAVEYDIENCEYKIIDFSFYAFGDKYKTKEELKKAIISKKVESF